MWRSTKSALGRWVPGVSRAQSNANLAKAQGNRARSMGKQASRLSTLFGWLLLAALVGAIWWLGPQWQLRDSYPLAPWLNRLLATLALATLVAVVWGVRLARRLREAQPKRTAAARSGAGPGRASGNDAQRHSG